MAGEILIEGLPMDRINVHPSISELFFNTHHDFSDSPNNTSMAFNKGYFNLESEAKDFLCSLRELKVRESYNLNETKLIADFLMRV